MGERTRARPAAYEGVDGRDVARPCPKGLVVLPEELKCHCSSTNCWVAVYGVIYDLSPLLSLNKNELALPLIQHAGRDISSWFCRETLQPLAIARVRSDTAEVYVHPDAPFLHVPGSGCTDTPWWRDRRYVVGEFAESPLKVTLLNTLTTQETEIRLAATQPLKVASEQQLQRINSHAHAYTWSCLGRALDLEKSLKQNGIEAPKASGETRRIAFEQQMHRWQQQQQQQAQSCHFDNRQQLRTSLPQAPDSHWDRPIPRYPAS
ncbi:hypothetical protein Esti_000585 [Eimeria stiedai]